MAVVVIPNGNKPVSMSDVVVVGPAVHRDDARCHIRRARGWLECLGALLTTNCIIKLLFSELLFILSDAFLLIGVLPLGDFIF